MSPDSDAIPSAVTTTWSDFTNKLLPTGQVLIPMFIPHFQIARIVVYPEVDQAIIHMYAGAKTFAGEPVWPFSSNIFVSAGKRLPSRTSVCVSL